MQDLRRPIRVIRDQRVRADAGEIGHVFLGIDCPVLNGQIMRVGKVDDRCGAEVDAEARLRVAERQLEHVVGAGEIRFAGQGGKVELHDLRGLALRCMSG